MRQFPIIAILPALAACGSPIYDRPDTVIVDPAPTAATAMPTEPVRIMTASEFGATVVGRRLTAGPDSILLAQDGSMQGVFGGRVLSAAWTFEDGSFCRTLIDYEGAAPVDECQIVMLNPDGTVSFIAPGDRVGTFQVT